MPRYIIENVPMKIYYPEEATETASIKKANAAKACPHCHTPQPVSNNNLYYTDTISKAGVEPATASQPLSSAKQATAPVDYQEESYSIIDANYNKLSTQFDIALEDIDLDPNKFEILQNLIQQIIMLQMRIGARNNQEHIFTLENITINATVIKVQQTHNVLKATAITVFSVVVSVAGASLAFVPAYAAASQPLSTAGQSINSIAGIFTNIAEGERTLLQNTVTNQRAKLETTKDAKHGQKEIQKTARAAREEFDRTRHETVRAMNSAS